MARRFKIALTAWMAFGFLVDEAVWLHINTPKFRELLSNGMSRKDLAYNIVMSRGGRHDGSAEKALNVYLLWPRTIWAGVVVRQREELIERLQTMSDWMSWLQDKYPDAYTVTGPNHVHLNIDMVPHWCLTQIRSTFSKEGVTVCLLHSDGLMHNALGMEVPTLHLEEDMQRLREMISGEFTSVEVDQFIQQRAFAVGNYPQEVNHDA